VEPPKPERGPSRPGAEPPGPARDVETGPSHVRADRDLALLARDELRAVRLQLEYLKPELAFEDLAVRHTIVVFGSTRLLEPAEARARLDEARSAGEGAAVARAEADLARSRYYEIGRELGRLVGRSGHGPHNARLAVVTGGGPGGMEAANRGALEVGAASVGLNITLPQEQLPNPYITPELCFQFRYFALRKLHFMMRARALVALPGGYGTLDELFETLCLVQTGKRAPLPVVLVGESFWRRAVDFDFLVEERMIDPEDRALFEFADTAEETWSRIVRWYEARGRSVLDVEEGPAPELNE